MIIAIGAVPLSLLLGLDWKLAFIGGAVLASTDPVVLRGIVRDERIPRSVRQILKIEAGMNDIVVLPVVLILIAVAQSATSGAGEWAGFLLKLLLLGPAIGFAVGGGGSWLMTRVDSIASVRREYQSLYGLGLVFASFAAGTAVGGDGFLAAFAGGLAVVLLNHQLCDCFLELGEVTSETAMLLCFVLFGSALSAGLGAVSIGPALVISALVVFAIRPPVLGLVLSKARMSWEAHAFVSWFGPRGLNSLLLVLLVVQAGVAQSEVLFAAVGVVVLASVAIHGATAVPATAWYGRRAKRATLAEERESTAAGLFSSDESDVSYVTTEELVARLDGPAPPIVLDVRSRSDYDRDRFRIPGSVRVLPDQVPEWADDRPRDGSIVAYCS
jgi:NhaP-type Na+/H+ or K+/H+ antiporter